MALALILAGLAMATPAAHAQPPSAARPGCARHDLAVTLTFNPGAAQYRLAGSLCRPARPATTVQLLIPGRTYSHRYWTYPDQRTNYTAAALAAGDAVYLIDRISTGASDRPPADQVTTTEATVTHQVVRALRNGTPGRFTRVVSVGHSYGSVIAMAEAATYPDVDALVLTGVLHHIRIDEMTRFTTDLRSLPAWGISMSQEDDKTFVNFGATVWNAGTSPLLVDGFRRTGTELMDAYQYFFDAKGNEVGSVEAGTMEWDPRDGHRHWHFTDFAQYNLLAGDQKLAVRSGKEAFCLANTDAIDYTIPNAKWRPGNTDLSSSCGQNTAVAVREVLDIANGDTYTQDRPGQSFEIKLGGTPTARTLEVPSVHGLD